MTDMPATNPPYLRTIRTLLLLIDLAAISIIVLPTFGSRGLFGGLSGAGPVSPYQIMNHNSGADWWDAFICLSPFVLPVFVAMIQARSFCDAKIRRHELLIAQVIRYCIELAEFVFCSFILLSITVSQLQNHFAPTGSSSVIVNPVRPLYLVGYASLGLGTVGFIVLGLIAWRRRLHRDALVLAGFRYVYVVAIGYPLVSFGSIMDFALGAWLCVGICIWYLFEIVLLFIYGKGTSSGAFQRSLMRYWLPSEEVVTAGEWNTCANCGYDLRGTVQGNNGKRICPECGVEAVSA